MAKTRTKKGQASPTVTDRKHADLEPHVDMPTLQIEPKLKDLLPPLAEVELAGLEKDILARGVLSPLVVWHGILVDGHHSIRVTASSGRCVIGLSSLNRAAGKEGYDANTLTLSSFKESGEIEYGADDCFGVCFGKSYESGKLLVPVKHLKSRHHERQDFDLLFDGALQSFAPFGIS